MELKDDFILVKKNSDFPKCVFKKLVKIAYYEQTIHIFNYFPPK